VTGIDLEVAAVSLAGLTGPLRPGAGQNPGQLPGDVPPAGAPLQRERDVIAAGEPHQPGPQVHAAGRAIWPRFTSLVAVSR